MAHSDADQSFCEKILRKHLDGSPLVHFLQDALKKTRGYKDEGRPIIFKCAPCTPEEGSGLFKSATNTITICQNVIQSVQHVEDTLGHELIHAIDHSRIDGGLKEDDCRQIACSEIRAANLSGDCKWSREFLRGHWSNVAGQHRICVRRRARMSLLANPNCRECNADAILEELFESCYRDTFPFIDIP